MSATLAATPDRIREVKRCSKACERCRSMKVKCSGTQPCARCGRKRKVCQYPARERRISVPESYLEELRNRERGSRPPASVVSTDPDFPPRSHPRQQEQEPDRVSLPSQQGSSSSPQDEGLASEPSRNHPRATSAEPFGLYARGGAVPVSEQTNGADEQNLRETLSEADVGMVEDVTAMVEPHRPSNFRQNPLVDNDYTFTHAAGKILYMGPSSSWSFCRRVLALVGRRIPTPNSVPDPIHFDGSAFRLQWKPLGRDETPDVSHIPPLDYALLLFNTTKFYFGHLFYLVDEPDFLRELHELYENPVAKVQSSRLWYAQYLLILAFGKAFLGPGGSHGPPGYQFAARAMGLMPDYTDYEVAAVQSIQTLALAALYLQSIDMRTAAFQHIGQALRASIIEGMHRHMPEESVGVEYSRRCSLLFWVIYMLDREFAALIGAPSSIRDEDISAKKPTEFSQGRDAWNMTLHVQLSKLMARILTTVYGVGENFDGSLVTNTQSILRNLAHISQDLTTLLNTHFQGSVNKASRMALRLVLSYHRCVVLTTRPLVMCALHKHIEQNEAQVSRHSIELTPTVASLIQACVDSAQTILRTLRALGDESILESFLPFQLEDAFSSAFILYLVNAITPFLVPDDSWRTDVYCVLDKMISQGSLVAPLRKLELSQLEDLMGSLTPCAYQLSPPPDLDLLHPRASIAHEADDVDPGWDLFMDHGMIGMSPRELLELAEQLDVNGFGAPRLDDESMSIV